MNKLFLIKTKDGKEAMMRSPVGKHDLFTPKAFMMIKARLGTFQYALDIEAYSDGESLLKALKNYQKLSL